MISPNFGISNYSRFNRADFHFADIREPLTDVVEVQLTGIATLGRRIEIPNMHLFRETLLLFGLNLLDALLTLVWVRSGVATEGNQLMAKLLDIGDLTFLSAKIAIGLIAAAVLLKWGNLKVAKYGVTVALTLYIGLMGVHFITGLAAFGIVSENFIRALPNIAVGLFAAFL